MTSWFNCGAQALPPEVINNTLQWWIVNTPCVMRCLCNYIFFTVWKVKHFDFFSAGAATCTKWCKQNRNVHEVRKNGLIQNTSEALVLNALKCVDAEISGIQASHFPSAQNSFTLLKRACCCTNSRKKSKYGIHPFTKVLLLPLEVIPFCISS